MYLITMVIALILSWFISTTLIEKRNNKLSDDEANIIINKAERDLRDLINNIEDTNTKQTLTKIADMLFKGLQ